LPFLNLSVSQLPPFSFPPIPPILIPQFGKSSNSIQCMVTATTTTCWGQGFAHSYRFLPFV
jgi:hypothetical protein